MRPLPFFKPPRRRSDRACRSISASSTAPRVIVPNQLPKGTVPRFKGLDPRILEGDFNNAHHVGQVEDDGRSREDGQQTV